MTKKNGSGHNDPEIIQLRYIEPNQKPVLSGPILSGPFCNLHNRVNAEHYCCDCHRLFCGACNFDQCNEESHQVVPVTTDFDVHLVQLSDLMYRRNLLCNTHKEKLHVWCRQCNEQCCVLCYFKEGESHFKHHCVSYEDHVRKNLRIDDGVLVRKGVENYFMKEPRNISPARDGSFFAIIDSFTRKLLVFSNKMTDPRVYYLEEKVFSYHIAVRIDVSGLIHVMGSRGDVDVYRETMNKLEHVRTAKLSAKEVGEFPSHFDINDEGYYISGYKNSGVILFFQGPKPWKITTEPFDQMLFDRQGNIVVTRMNGERHVLNTIGDIIHAETFSCFPWTVMRDDGYVILSRETGIMGFYNNKYEYQYYLTLEDKPRDLEFVGDKIITIHSDRGFVIGCVTMISASSVPRNENPEDDPDGKNVTED